MTECSEYHHDAQSMNVIRDIIVTVNVIRDIIVTVNVIRDIMLL